MKRQDKKQDRIKKKHLILEVLLKRCQEQNKLVFHNDLVKEICREYHFGNPFDITKLDSGDKLPLLFLAQDICLLHLGKGWHQFIYGIDKLYHAFEPMQDSIEWKYRKSLLNEYNNSESNILSVANNQGILHHFLFFDECKLLEEFRNNISGLSSAVFMHEKWIHSYWIDNRSVKTYFPHRTKTTLEYHFNDQEIVAKNQQIEIDLTLEYDGMICVFEAKNGTPEDFNICQIYHPFLYYYNSGLKIKQIKCVYLVRNIDSLKLWAYTFEEPKRLDSIKFLKSCEYNLIRR